MFFVGSNKFLTIICFAGLFSFSNVYANQLKGQNRLIPNEREYRFYIKFKAEIYADLDNGHVQFYSKRSTRSDELLQKLEGYSFEPVIALSPEERVDVRSGKGYRVRSNAFDPRLFSGLVQLINSIMYSPERLMVMAVDFESFDDVEYCELTPFNPPPPPSIEDAPARLMSPDYTSRQWYREYNHGGDTIGINIDYAWSIGIKGQGVRVADVEWGWNYNHEDLKRSIFIDGFTTTDHQYDDHGTAVAGIMCAIENTFGITGMVHQIECFTGYSEIPSGRPHAIGLAVAGLRAGDVLVYEMQTSSGPDGFTYVPADYEQSVWDVTKAATKAGIIVVAAAGNGNGNLDGSYYSDYMNRGDNGSIIAGAGTIKGRNKASFSTYGSRVNVQGWGDYCVMSTGYGDIYNGGTNATYTEKFAGTSSATPIVSSAVVAVQSYTKSKYGKTLLPAEIRDVLVKTGTPQGSGGHIGPLPNVQKAILRIDSLYGGTPIVTTVAQHQSNKPLFTLQGSRLVLHCIRGATIFIYNSRGLLVEKITVAAEINEVNLASVNLSTGVYMIRVASVGGSAGIERFIRR